MSQRRPVAANSPTLKLAIGTESHINANARHAYASIGADCDYTHCTILFPPPRPASVA